MTPSAASSDAPDASGAGAGAASGPGCAGNSGKGCGARRDGNGDANGSVPPRSASPE